MKLYNEIAYAYKSVATNLFAVTGNINDIAIYKEKNRQNVKQIEEILIEKLQKNNHLLYFSPSVGIKYTDKRDLDEFYSIDPTLKEIHQKAFSLDYAHTKYDILSGLHMIKVLLSSYREMRKKYKDTELKNLVVLIDDADIVFPNKPVEHMSNDERLILSLAREMLGSGEFTNSSDSVILLSESFLAISQGVRAIMGLYQIEVPLPDEETRVAFISYENAIYDKGIKDEQIKEIAALSAGITLVTLQSILKQEPKRITAHIKNEVAKIIEKSLGSHVKVLHPTYGFEQVIGYEDLKAKARTLIKRMNSKNPWRAIAYIGATGTGKDFQTEAFLYEAGIPIMKLQTIKSKWYGETAVILEKIKMVAKSFNKIAIFKSEADKLFPDPQAKQTHQTDQELTAIFLDWMADNSDRGRVFWIFNTSRPQMFPVDFQRRIEIKLPIFDLNKDERSSFIELMFQSKGIDIKKYKKRQELVKYTEGFSSDNIRMMVYEVASELEIEPNLDIVEIVKDLNFDIVKSQRQQQAKYAAQFSTYRSLIPKIYQNKAHLQ